MTESRHGERALLLSAAVYGVSTTMSVVVLRAVRPVDLLAVEISGAAGLLLITAAARRQLRRRGASRQMLVDRRQQTRHGRLRGLAGLPRGAGVRGSAASCSTGASARCPRPGPRNWAT